MKQVDRKLEHLELTTKAQMDSALKDDRFFYEPLFGSFQKLNLEQSFLNKSLAYPLWISSMTGGTEKAFFINENLSRVCGQHKLGMGLGSLRPLLKDLSRLKDFDFRSKLGTSQPLLGNLGIVQIDELITTRSLDKIQSLVELLNLDGIFIHINPLQELNQPEGDFLKRPACEIIQEFCEAKPKYKIMVKEVGQGMGPKSLNFLLDLPIDGIEFAAFGGTNFAKLEALRSMSLNPYAELSKVGQTAPQMIEILAKLLKQKDLSLLTCKNFIISGGVKNYLDGFYLLELFKKELGVKAQEVQMVYGQAKPMLDHASEGFAELEKFIQSQMQGFMMAKQFLTLK
jgi:isopentenyl-diphosphate delta-isomerase